MAYKSSPRPVFSGATHIPYSGVTRFLWGDEEAGFVDDWIYASTDKIHQLVFGLLFLFYGQCLSAVALYIRAAFQHFKSVALR